MLKWLRLNILVVGILPVKTMAPSSWAYIKFSSLFKF